MKRLALINLALSFSAIVMADTERTNIWAILILLTWFLISAIWAGHMFSKINQNHYPQDQPLPDEQFYEDCNSKYL
jgi:hypothetical protein